MILQGWRITDVADTLGVAGHRIVGMCRKVQDMLTSGTPITFDIRKRYPAWSVCCFRGDREYWMKQVQRLKAALGITTPLPKPYCRPYPFEQHQRNINILIDLANRETTYKLATKYGLSTARIEAAGRRMAAVGKYLTETGSVASPGILMSMTFIRSDPALIMSYLPALRRHYKLPE